MDFFLAGSETTANSLSFGILFMALNPDIQKKVHDEIDRVISGHRYPTMEDEPL